MTVRIQPESGLLKRFREVRAATERLREGLSAEDCVVQSRVEASPVKWHLAHTSWFFETFVLAAARPDARPFHPRYGYLFNSYYESVGRRVDRGGRGLLTRPTLDEVLAYRRHVDDAVTALLERDALDARLSDVVRLGLAHEEQHQELILTDLKHHLSCNPLLPAYRDVAASSPTTPGAARWVAFDEGLREVGANDLAPGVDEAFVFDNETPRHRAFVQAFELASRPVTVGEYLEFVEDGGYRTPRLWLSDGWARVQQEGWRAPLYWTDADGGWATFTLAGPRPVEPSEPVCHVSYYEADAFATWAGARLPREAEWEVAAATARVEGNFVETGAFHPRPIAAGSPGDAPSALFGDVWEWTQSPYVAYPGYRAAEGALGEYNGKFMCNQLVLRGGSCASPRAHLRASYRNFFHPDARWQFSGLRLARDA